MAAFSFGLSLLFIISITLADSYTPVLICLGIGFSSDDIEYEHAIKRAHPGTETYVPNMLWGAETFLPLWNQLHLLYLDKDFKSFIHKHSGGIHVVARSMGTLIARGLIQAYGIKVIKFISVAGVHCGGYGLPIVQKYIDIFKMRSLSNIPLELMHKVFYTSVAQDTTSLANLWHDPHREKEYLNSTVFLPLLNNRIIHKNYKAFKHNFCKLQEVILIAGPDDDIIIPWQSGLFGYYNEKLEIIPMEEQEFYKTDSFCLRTLNETGRLKQYVVPGHNHNDFVTKAEPGSAFYEYVLPALD